MRIRILNLQRMSTEDGPGIRTTVFAKGCPLRCDWCHNPESISAAPRTVWSAQKCIDCHGCDGACPHGALERLADRLRPDPDRCQVCGTCAEACPTTALEVLGQDWEVEALLAELERDRAYFEESGGGVTLSGGDPLAQPEAAIALLGACRESGLHTALDTCGACPPEPLLRAVEHSDLVLFDLKEIDPQRHAAHTGRSNERILDNLWTVAQALGHGQKLWIRTPLIPGATARPENIDGLGRFLAEQLAGRVDRWELLAFNNLCREQYQRLGQAWPYADAPLLSAAELGALVEVARQSGVDPACVVGSGPTRME